MSPSERLRISAVLPCFEEAANLERVVDELIRALVVSACEWEVVLVTTRLARDETAQLATELTAREPAVVAVEQPAQRPGYGGALAFGIGRARLPWLFLSDADGQFDHAELGRFVACARSADVILGYRAGRRDAPARRLAGNAYGWAVRRAAGIGGIRDVDCAFKLLRAELLEGPPFRSQTGAVNAEIIARALAAGGRIQQLPVTHRQRLAGSSRFETRLAGLPRPSEALSILGDVAALAGRRFVAGFTRRP